MSSADQETSERQEWCLGWKIVLEMNGGLGTPHNLLVSHFSAGPSN